MATISYLTTIQFDFGAIGLVPAECQRLGMTRPLIVTDQGVVAAGLLERRLGLPKGLAAMGVPREALPSVARAAMKDHCHGTNPRPATADDYLAMLEESFHGSARPCAP